MTDRGADLAVATWSAEWNYGPGWDDHLLAPYGAEPHPARIAYYRLCGTSAPESRNRVLAAVSGLVDHQ